MRSTSPLAPFRQDGFPEEYATFKDASSYNKWEFSYTPKTATGNPASPASPAIPSRQLTHDFFR